MYLNGKMLNKGMEVIGYMRKYKLFVGVTPHANIKTADKRAESDGPKVVIANLQNAFQCGGLTQRLIQYPHQVRWSCLQKNSSTITHMRVYNDFTTKDNATLSSRVLRQVSTFPIHYIHHLWPLPWAYEIVGLNIAWE